ncbi:Uncharacterised protein [Candidatus Gugararchaeum adminiculabundum]|nr:Uncharacterised protein [Candidatus Gugararchaeum adminiculabundum]
MRLKPEIVTLGILSILFVLMGAAFLNVTLGSWCWWILVAAAIGFFLYELKVNEIGITSELAKKALLVGLFLMLFDFGVENTGWILGYWHTQNGIIAVGTVPLAVMLVCFIGGAGWALYLPKKFDLGFSLYDSLVFAFWGALGEWVLSTQGLMVYTKGWTSALAFGAYFITWAVLHWVRYKSPLKISE